MSNKKVTDADEAADNADKPMEDPFVDVTVRPVKHKVRGKMPREKKEKSQRQNDENRELAKKVQENLQREIVKKVAEAGKKPGATRQDQYDAADKAADDAAHQTPRQKINQIDVGVGDSKDDHWKEVTPKEGAPPHDEED